MHTESMKHLTKVSALSLTGFEVFDLCCIPPSVHILRIVNPLTIRETPFGTSPGTLFPKWANPDGSARLQGEPGKCDLDNGTAHAASMWEDAEECEANPEDVSAPPAMGAASQEDLDLPLGGRRKYGKRKHSHHHQPQPDSDDERNHPPCDDPHCPVHSGKRVLQVGDMGGHAWACFVTQCTFLSLVLHPK
jgi:hypothetical protein